LADFAIGVDLGGTNLRAAAITHDGALLEDFQVATEAEAGRDKVTSNIMAGIRQVQTGHDGDKLLGIGIGVPGLIRLEEGVIVASPNLPGWEDFPLRDKLEGELGCPVVLENDANAAALGEVWLGAGRDVDDLILLTLGTGIGGAVISGGKVLHGQDGMAGELGHITVESHGGALCGCGNYGCVEAEASATAVRRMAEEAIAAGSSPALAKLAESHGGVTARLVDAAAQDGDAEAIRIYEHMGEALGRAVANLVNIFNFPLYLLAGGVLAAWDRFAPAMFLEVKKRSYTYRQTNTRIEKAQLGNKAGLYGAAYLPIQQSR
jgi:glucokinase